jgi:hypothetical protein
LLYTYDGARPFRAPEIFFELQPLGDEDECRLLSGCLGVLDLSMSDHAFILRRAGRRRLVARTALDCSGSGFRKLFGTAAAEIVLRLPLLRMAFRILSARIRVDEV